MDKFLILAGNTDSEDESEIDSDGWNTDIDDANEVV